MNGAGDTENLKEKKGMSANRNHSYIGVPTSDYDRDRDEKPWQRVVFEITRKGTHLYEPVKSVPCTALVLLLGVYLLLGYLTQLVEDDMPSVISDTNIARDNTDTFSEEAAWRYLRDIVGDGPRVCGNVYHYNKTEDMKRIVDDIARQANVPIRTDWQMASGDYFLNSSSPVVNFYQDASNVIAVLEGESGFHSNGTIGTSILLNCHYDSVPYALGASDNAIFCAVMAEVLDRLSRRSQRFKHNIIFLFNGAEENGLQASHAFLQHPWSRGVSAVVNLDAAGMNGKPAVFQVTDPRVLSGYRRSTYRPNAQGVGEFLFASGIIPSDTDFRIWRDFGQIYGVDIAFTKWGHVYHTRYDNLDLIRPGVIQCAGNMLHAVATELADNEQLSEKIEPSAAVYYDYLNTFLVTYSMGAAKAVDVIIALFAILSVAYSVWLVGPRWSTVRELLFSLLGRVAALVAGAIIVAVFTPIMVATTSQLRYLTEPWLVVPLYWVPYLIAAVGTSQAFDAWRGKESGLNRCIRTIQAMAATRLLLAVLLLVMTCIPVLTTATYAVTVPLFIMSALSLVTLTVIRYWRIAAWQHLLLEVLFSLPSVMFVMTLALRLDAMMLPISGRSGGDYPDYLVAAINVGLCALTAATVSGIELLFSRKRLWMVASALGLVCLVLMFIPFSPYSDDGPSTQRHYWFHTQISTYNRQNVLTERHSGVVVTKHDAYSTHTVIPALKQHGLNYASRTDFDKDCENYVLCNLPLYRFSFQRFLREALFLYSGPPREFNPQPNIRLNNSTCTGETCTYHFTMIGSAHNMITIWPRSNVSLSSWTLQSKLNPTLHQKDRPVYVIVHSVATYKPVLDPLDFSLTANIPTSLQNEIAFDISHHAHKIHHPDDYTDEYRTLLQAMPRYFNIASFLTFRNNYVF